MIENSLIGFDKGKFILVVVVSIFVDEGGYIVVDVSGKYIYFGFIIFNS